MLCYADEQAWEKAGEPARQAAVREAVRLTHELDGKGQYVLCSRLHPTATATSVRVRDGKPLVTDGPFAETREQLGGFYLIEANDLGEIIGMAARHAAVSRGTVEIRPLLEIPGFPAGK